MLPLQPVLLPNPQTFQVQISERGSSFLHSNTNVCQFSAALKPLPLTLLLRRRLQPLPLMLLLQPQPLPLMLPLQPVLLPNPQTFQVQISERGSSFMHFITNVCAIVGGVFTVSGIIDSFIYQSEKIIRKKLDLGKLS